MKAVLLDTGPLGLVTNPKASPEADACKQWFADIDAAGVLVLVPEIADYEVRRELLRAWKVNGLKRLDAFVTAAGNNYLPITTTIMRRAAALWATARQTGKPTASDASLDADMILIAQAHALGLPENAVVIATENVSDIARFFPADRWNNIRPRTLRSIASHCTPALVEKR